MQNLFKMKNSQQLKYFFFYILFCLNVVHVWGQCPPPAFPGYGTGSNWNVGVYKDGLNYDFINYKGYYTTPSTAVNGFVNPTAPTVIGAGSFEFNTSTHGYGVTQPPNPPSNAPGYQGCVVSPDTFSLWAQKTDFFCGYYKVYLQYYDDDTRIIIDTNGDGTPEFTSSYVHPPCFSPGCNSVVWEGFLSGDSKVDIQAIDINLDFVVHWAFLKQPIVYNVTNNGPVCAGQPVTLTANLLVNGVSKILPNYSFIPSGGTPISTTTNTLVVTPTTTPAYYTVFFGTNTNCLVTQATTVNSTGTPPIASNTGPKCVGGTVSLSALPNGASSYAWSGPNGFTSNAQNPVLNNITALQVGTYTVTVTTGTCVATATTTVIINPKPTLIPFSVPAPACAGSTVTLQLPPPTDPTWTYNWQGPGVNSTNPTVNTPPLNCPSGCTYSVTVTDQSGCTATQSVTLNTQTPPPIPPVLSTTNINICPGNTGTVSVTGANAPIINTFVPLSLINTIINIPSGSVLTYIWKDPSGNIINNNTATLSNITAAGTYTVAFSFSNAGIISTCVGPTTSFTVNLQNINVSATKTAICAGESVTLTATGGTGITWSTGQSGSSIIVSPVASITYTATSSGGCTSSVSIVVNIPTPIVVSASSMNVCAGTSTTISVSPTTYSSYTWSPTGSGSSFSATPLANTTYSVTATDANGCSTIGSKTVTVSPPLNPVITGSNTICSGATVALDAGATYDTYSWGGGQSTQSINITAAGTYTVTVTKNGCVGTATFTVTPSVNLTPIITGISPICVGSNTTFSVANFDTYAWSNGSTTQSITVSTAGTYTVTVTQSGCSGTNSKTLVVQAVPVFNVNPSGASICQGQTTTLTASSGFNNYLWSPTGNTTNTVSVSNAGTYTVTATDGVCNVTASSTVAVNPNPTPVITGNSTICAGQNTTLDAGAAYDTYLWSTGATTQTISTNVAGTYSVTVTKNTCSGSASIVVTVSSGLSPIILGNANACKGVPSTLSVGNFSSYIWSTGATTQSITIPNNLATTYTVTVTQGGCTGTATKTVIVNNPSPINLFASALNICAGDTAILMVSSGLNNYQWSPSGGNNSTAYITSAGTYTVTATDGICNLSLTTAVTVIPVPTATVSGNTSICSGNSTTLSVSPTGVSYQWSNGSTGATSIYNTTGVAAVTVTLANGCLAKANVNITLNNGANAVVTASKSTICKGESTILQASGGVSYLWENGVSTNINSVTPVFSSIYKVTVTDVNGCTNVGQIPISVKFPTPIILPSTISFCKNDSVLVQANPNNLASYLWSNGNTTPSIYIKTVGNFFVVGTNNSGCKDTTLFNTSNYIVNNVTINGSKTFCPGSKTTLDAGNFANYLWSTGATTQTISTNIGGSVSVTVTDNNGCKSSASATIMAANKLNFSIKGKDFCQNSNTVLDAGPFKTYLWSNGDTTQKITVSKAGKYCVTVSDGNCIGDTCIDIKENPLPIVNILGKTSICKGGITTLSLNNTFSKVTWSYLNASNSSIIIGEGTYTVTVTDANMCTATTQANVTATPLPQPILIAPKEICANSKDSITLTSNFSSYKWLPNNETTAKIMVTKADTYTVVVTDALGCTGSSTVNIGQKQALIPVIIGDDEVCAGGNTQFVVVGNGKNFKWSNGDTTSSIIISKTGTYTVTVTGDGCPATASKTFTVNSLPNAKIIGDTIICNGTPTKLTATGGVKYLWSNSAMSNTITVNQVGQVWVIVTDKKNCVAIDTIDIKIGGVRIKIDTSICEGQSLKIKNQIFDVNNLKSTFTVSSTNGCDTIYEVNVKVKLKAKVSLQGSTSICPGQKVDIVIDAGIYTGFFDLEYAINGVKQPVLKGVKNGDIIKANPLIMTVYKITNLIFPPTFCPATIGTAAKIEVGGLALETKATSNFNGFNVACNGSNNGTAEVTISGGKSPYIYQWSNGSVLNKIENISKGKYYISVTDATGCKGVDSVNILEPKALKANFKSIAPICKKPKSAIIQIDSLLGGVSPFTYALNNGAVQGISSNSFVINNLDGGVYVLTIKDANGCDLQKTIDVPKSADLKLFVGSDITIDYGDSIALEAKANFLIDKIKWNTKQYLTCNNCPNPISKPLKSITYAAIATDSSGCSATDSIRIDVNKAFNVYIPNSFSPNGDTNNDVFMIFGDAKFVVNIKSFKVFDRWGNTVFSDFNFKPNDPTHGWDGTFRGQKMNNAVFVYAVEVEFRGGDTEVFKGDVTLLYE